MEPLHNLTDCVSALQALLAFLDAADGSVGVDPVNIATAAAYLQHAVELLNQPQSAKP